MANKLWAKQTIGAGNKENMLERAKVLDGYNTPKIAVLALLKNEKLQTNVWEPANGFSKITQILENRGHTVFTSDIHRWHKRTDLQKAFENFQKLPKDFRKTGCDIITNPPYCKAKMFTEKALSLLQEGDKLCLLLKLQFLEGQRRKPMFEKYPPKCVYIFSKRLPRMHRFLWKGHKGGNTLAFAWFVWVKGFKGNPQIKWI